MNGITKDLTRRRDQAKIDTPGVDADRIDLLVGAASQALLDLFPLRKQIPVQRAVQPADQVREAVALLDAQVIALELGQRRAATFCAQINCHVMVDWHPKSD